MQSKLLKGGFYSGDIGFASQGFLKGDSRSLDPKRWTRNPRLLGVSRGILILGG